MWWHGFGVVNIMGTNSKEALVGDLAIKINHRRFDRQTQVWIKIHDGAKEWKNVRQFQCRFFSIPTFLSVDVSRFKEKGEIPKVGDI